MKPMPLHRGSNTPGVRGLAPAGCGSRAAVAEAQPMAAAFTSASMKGTYWPKFFENISTSFFACAS